MARYLSTTGSRILWLFLLLIFGAIVTHLSVQAYRAMTSKTWPVTQGKVFAYYDAPNYRYTVAGASYEASYISCNEFFSSRDRKSADKYLALYPLNGTVKVHYHPTKPDLAVLETKFDAGIFKVIGVLLLIWLVCLLGFYRGWRWRLRRRGIWPDDDD